MNKDKQLHVYKELLYNLVTCASMDLHSLMTPDKDPHTHEKRKKWMDDRTLDHLQKRRVFIYEPGGGKFGSLDLKDRTKFDTVKLPVIESLWNLFHTESILITIFQISANGMIGTGCLFQHGEHFLDECTSRELRYFYSNFIRDLLKYAFIYGFAVVCLERHPTLKAVPRVVDLRLIRTTVKRDFLGENHYYFYPIQSHLSDPPPLEGLYVFELDKPDGATLRSRIFSLKQDFDMYRIARSCFVVSAKLASNPPRILQPVQEKYDESKLTINYVPNEELGASGPAAPMRLSATAKESAERQIQAVSNINQGLHPGANPKMYETVDEKTGTVRLNMGYTLAKQQMPMPLDLTEITMRLEERAATVFCVPRNLFAQNGSGRAIAADSDKTENTFLEGQRGLKTYAVNAVNMLYNLINGDDFGKSVLKSMSTEEILDTRSHETFARKSRLTVSLPSFPSTEIMQQYFIMGWLKYEALTHSITSRDHMPLDWFNKDPKLDIADLAGIKPEVAPEEKTTTTVKSDGKQSAANGSSKSNSSTTTTTQVKPSQNVDKKPPTPREKVKFMKKLPSGEPSKKKQKTK